MDKKNKEKKLGRNSKASLKKIVSQIRFEESYVSLILGMVVVFVAIFLAIIFVRGKRTQEVSSVKTEDLPKVLKEINTKNKKESNSEQQKYTVGSGDTLWSIAEKKYQSGFKWKEIAMANNITDPTVIKQGDILLIPTIEQKNNSIIPTPTKSSSGQKENAPNMENTNKIVQDSYTVVTGDSLWDIAVRSYGDGFRWVDIAKTNSLANPDLIFPGNVFKIPR